MAGFLNRDFCGDESSISQLSNHLSKNLSFKQESIINQNSLSNNVQSIPTSFNVHELLKTIENENQIKHSNSIHMPSNVIESKAEINTSVIPERSQGYPTSFITPTYFSIPQPKFYAPDHSLVANEWARNELSQFDNLIITEEDLKILSNSNDSNDAVLKFSDVIRKLALEEQNNDIDWFNDDFKQAQGDYLYDLDNDLRQMRDKLTANEDLPDMFLQTNNEMKNKLIDFVFLDTNPYTDSLNNSLEDKNEVCEKLLNDGIKLYQQGYFSEAMLMFEAVAQERPKSEKAWHYLAISLSENEQDDRAMVACNKCLSINKDNLEILLSLARIHCNNMDVPNTVNSLERWLLSNAKYSDLATVGQDAVHNIENTDDSMWQDIFEDSFLSSGQFEIIKEQFTIAHERNGQNVDAELETAIGTLYHVIQDYEKSTAHFENATTVSQNSALLWNKLATSYCNSGNYEKAINTYKNALELAPGFVRAECNLGVSFYNLGNYADAIKHALNAYRLQHSTVNKEFSGNIHSVPETVVETDPIWTLIRMSCFKMNRPDLDLVVFSRDVDTLMKEFII